MTNYERYFGSPEKAARMTKMILDTTDCFTLLFTGTACQTCKHRKECDAGTYDVTEFNIEWLNSEAE